MKITENYNSLNPFIKIHFSTITSFPSFFSAANLGAKKDAPIAEINEMYNESKVNTIDNPKRNKINRIANPRKL